MRSLICLLLAGFMLCAAMPALSETMLVEEGPLAVTTLPVRELTTDGALIPVETAIQAASTALQAHHQDDAAILTVPFQCSTHRIALTTGQTAWVISLFGQVGGVPVECVVTLDDAQGTLLRYEENNTGWFRVPQSRWEAVYGAYGTWPLETQVLFDLLYCLEVTHSTLPEDCIPEQQAYTLALQAAGLSADTAGLSYQRTLNMDSQAPDAREQYVWVITLYLDEERAALVNISALDGTLLNLFEYEYQQSVG